MARTPAETIAAAEAILPGVADLWRRISGAIVGLPCETAAADALLAWARERPWADLASRKR